MSERPEFIHLNDRSPRRGSGFGEAMASRLPSADLSKLFTLPELSWTALVPYFDYAVRRMERYYRDDRLLRSVFCKIILECERAAIFQILGAELINRVRRELARQQRPACRPL